LAEVVRALQLEGLVAPFTRCRECNAPLEPHFGRMRGIFGRLGA
jgi:uncharacterized protein with PIN domain